MEVKAEAMNDERDKQSGRFKQKYDPEQILEAVHKEGGGATASEVADRLDAPRRSIHTRLSQLHEEGRLEKRDVGPSVLWTVADTEGY